ncbi:hypothetical protein J1N09_07645 [Aureitalea sp. L0-47]|uniref:hypothetical protein n=1 Tax=Aureitalea sp. L0-47 TaxID=2816962 RepID=UPI002238E480|nr:hypothetical protein [Aureitalea sp. L0-47]MCW5519707.1 hypothetical protein [Aureitalea sp. L0-47]
MKYILLYALILAAPLVSAQVGIGTTEPMETLHVNGTVRIESLAPDESTKIIGVDLKGNVTEVGVGDNLLLQDGTLHSNGSTKYFVQTITTPTISSGQVFHNVDLELETTNKDIVVFRLTGANHNYEFSGLSGGTDGKHIILLNTSANNFKISNESSNSSPENRITTLTGGFEQTSGEGLVELVYDGVSQRWIILSFRN